MDVKKWAARLIWIPAFVLVVVFLVANRQPVSISLDPFPSEAAAWATPPLPLWFWLMSMLFAGFGAGIVGMWLSARPGRQKARGERRELKAATRALADATARLSVYEARAAQTDDDMADADEDDAPKKLMSQDV